MVQKEIQIKMILFYILIIGTVFIGIAQISPWATPSDTYTWGLSSGGENSYFWEYLTDFDLETLDLLGVDYLLVSLMGFLLFPLSIMVLVMAIGSTKNIKIDMMQAMKGIRNTGIAGIFTGVWFHFFLDRYSNMVGGYVDFDWKIGSSLFVVGSILFISTAMFIHFMSEEFISLETRKSDRRCPDCGRVIPFDANVCPFCGKKFKRIGESSDGELKDISKGKLKSISKNKKKKGTK